MEAFHNLFEQTSTVYYPLIYMVVLGTVAAYLFWNYGISRLGAGKTAIFFNLIPIVTKYFPFWCVIIHKSNFISRKANSFCVNRMKYIGKRY